MKQSKKRRIQQLEIILGAHVPTKPTHAKLVLELIEEQPPEEQVEFWQFVIENSVRLLDNKKKFDRDHSIDKSWEIWNHDMISEAENFYEEVRTANEEPRAVAERLQDRVTKIQQEKTRGAAIVFLGHVLTDDDSITPYAHLKYRDIPDKEFKKLKRDKDLEKKGTLISLLFLNRRKKFKTTAEFAARMLQILDSETDPQKRLFLANGIFNAVSAGRGMSVLGSLGSLRSLILGVDEHDCEHCSVRETCELPQAEAWRSSRTPQGPGH